MNTGSGLVLTDSASLDADRSSWGEVAFGRGPISVEYGEYGWWLLPQRDLAVECFPVRHNVALGADVTVRYRGEPAFTLAVEPPPQAVWDFWVDSNRGVRFHQEDAVSASGWYLAIADGVGSSPTGHVASAGVIKALAVASAAGPPLVSPSGRVAQTAVPGAAGPRLVDWVAAVARDAIDFLIESRLGASGMSTTLTAAFGTPHSDGVLVHGAHVGDSSLFWFHADTGELEAATTPHHLPDQPNVLLRAISDDATPTLDPFDFVARPGDVLMLCTDGLSGVVALDQITELIINHRSKGAAALAEELVGLAIVEGTTDNVSVAVAVIPSDPVPVGTSSKSAQSPSLTLPLDDIETLTSEE